MVEPLLVINQREVRELLSMPDCIGLMGDAFAKLADGEAVQPLRQLMRLSGQRGILGTMPAEIGGLHGVKVISIFYDNHGTEFDPHQGGVLLFEGRNSLPIAFVDGTAVTAIRTAAVSALATRLLARPDARRLAILGSGTQARTHLAAMREVRPIEHVTVFSARPERARIFADREADRHGLPVEVAGSAAEAVASAEVICTTTSATEPVLFGEWLPRGVHVNAVGCCTPSTRELDTAAVANSRFFGDYRESTENESGEFLIPLEEGAITPEHLLGDLCDLVRGRVIGRETEADVTVYKSLGLGIEDIVAAGYVYRQARARSRGNAVSFAEAINDAE